MEKEITQLRERLEAPYMTGDKKQYHACKWLPKQAVGAKKDKFICMPYIDRTMVFERLDEVFTPQGWQTNIREISGGSFICELSVLINGDWVTKTDLGTETAVEKQKGAASDSIKRAATQLGIGRYLSDMKSRFVPAKVGSNGKPSPCDDHGKLLYGDQLHTFINQSMSKGKGLLYGVFVADPEIYQLPEAKALWEVLK